MALLSMDLPLTGRSDCGGFGSVSLGRSGLLASVVVSRPEAVLE